MLSVRVFTPATGNTLVKVLLWVPMNIWSYSTAADQFEAKPYSTPAPTVAPQRVEVERSRTVPVPVRRPSYLLSVTAAPPFAYRRALFQAKPIWPVNRPKASRRVRLVAPGAAKLGFDPRRSPQLPSASHPQTKPPTRQPIPTPPPA